MSRSRRGAARKLRIFTGLTRVLRASTWKCRQRAHRLAVGATVLRRVAKLRRLLIATRPDALLSFLTSNNVLSILATRGLNLRVVVSERAHPAHDTSVSPVLRLLRRGLYRWCDEVVAQTRETASWIEENCRRPANVIPNALRTLHVAADPKQPLIVAVGRLVRQKGFDLLLKAFANVCGKFPNWRVAIIGEGSERANLLRLCDSLGLNGHVEFVGKTQDVEGWLAQAGLVVQPSRFEGFPNAVLEAMGMGAAVISADCPAGPADLIEDGVNGRLVPVEDIDALSEAMAQLMSQPELRERLGREARKVRERFRQDLIMSQWERSLRIACAD